MRIECKLDSNGFYWRGLGLSVHLFKDQPVQGDEGAYWQPVGGLAAAVRLGKVAGFVSVAR
jgi:hypothetical protein